MLSLLGSQIFFWTAASVAECATAKRNGTKTLFTIDASTYFINGKPAVICDVRKLRNPPFSLIILLVVLYFIRMWLLV